MRFLTFLLAFITFCFYAQAGLKPVNSLHPPKKNPIIRFAPGHILTFKIPQQIAPEVIDETNHSIGIVVHAGQAITSLTPTITVTAGSTVNPASGVPQNFTSAVGYTVDGADPIGGTYYSVNVLAARSPSPICNGGFTTLTGDPPGAIPGTYIWQILSSPGNWTNAAGANTGADYTTAALSSNPTTAKIYSFRRSITTIFGTTYDSYNDLTVNPSVSIANNTAAASGATSFCVSGNVGIINGSPPTGGNGSYTYLWQISTNNGGSFSNIAGASAQLQSYVPPAPLTATTVYQRIVTSGPCTPPTISNPVKYTIVPPLTNNFLFPLGTTSFCDKSTPLIINGNIPSGGTGTVEYQWQRSVGGAPFTDITGPGTNGNDYDVPILLQTTSFRRGATSGACSTPIYSNVITINIIESINSNAITRHGPDVFCVGGDPETITGNQPGGGNGTLNYQWQSHIEGGSFANIQGANGQNYDPPPISVTTYYQRTVTSGPCTTPNIGNLIILTVLPALANNKITPPPVNSFCATGDPGVIQGNIPTGGDGTPVYTWESSTDGTNFNPIAGAAGQNYDPLPITITTYYRRGVTSGVCNTPLYSTPVKITVQNALSNNIITPPSTVNFCAGGTPGDIQGNPVTGGDGVNYNYQWQISTDGTNYTNLADGVGQNYHPQPVTQTTWYQRTVTSGACTVASISAPVKITVTPAITSNIINQPPNASYCVTSSPVTITGQPPTGGNGSYTYQWESSTNNTPYVPINGATAADYPVPALTTTTSFKRVVSSGFCVGTSESNAVVITINPALANNIITAPPVNKFCEAGDAGPITGPPPSGGDGNYTYRWEQSTDNIIFTPINGETGATFDPPNLTSTMFYRRVVTNSVCTTPLISNVVEIHITPPLTRNQITPPLTTTFCTSVDPAIIPTGFPQGGDGIASYKYQWQYSTDNGANWHDILVNGTSIDYDSPPITVTTSLRRTVTSGACTVPFPSNVVTFTIIPSPTNVLVNAVVPICPGNPATISVTSPDPNLTYLWYDSPSKNNNVYTGPVYTTDPLTASTKFYVEASNGTCASPLLTTVDVTVLTPPSAPVLVNATPVICAGSTTTLSVANPQASLTYNWYPSNANPDQPAIWSLPDFTPPPVGNNITYYVQAVNSAGCMSPYTAATITTKLAPKLVTAKGTSVCPGYQASLTATTFDQNVTINWYAAATGGSSLQVGPDFQTPPVNAATTYYVDATDNATGCPSPSRTAVQVDLLQHLATPVPFVSSVTTSTITFQWPAVPGAGEYEVSTDGGTTFTFPTGGVSGLTHEVSGLQVNESITIIVRATGAPCQLSANSLPVTGTTIDPLADLIFVANAFTPNGDGKNDVVYVRNRNIKSLKFYVYDQWGEMLYTTVNQQNGWDGTYKGRAEPAGVYVYYLEAIMNDGKQVKKKGTVTLIR
ncbi:MAG: gliding motility-associated C-terminal domain-containing protein [Bacteroidota bacterium]|nr:gliding motility-associated C-terminal domain-containing protein [Bacteroidota bacterium]